MLEFRCYRYVFRYKEHLRAYVKPLSREEQRALLDLLQTDLKNGDDSDQRRSILELQGLGREIWQGVDPKEYVRMLRVECV